MHESEAKILTAKLAAGFSRDWLGAASFEVYSERLARLENAEWAAVAIDELLDTSERLPTIMAIRETYKKVAADHAPLALEEPELTEEERQENIRRIRELRDHLIGSFGDV